MPTPTPINVLPLIVNGFMSGIPLYISIFAKIWWVFTLLLLLTIISIGIKIYDYQKLKKSGIYEIDKMTGEEFEERLKILFINLGYKAERTSPGKVKPDYGVDLIIEKDGIKTAVQAKRWKELVGEDAIRQAYSAKNYYNCTEAMVVTNSNFTKMAWTLAKSDNVKLWNRNYLIKVLLTEKNLTS